MIELEESRIKTLEGENFELQSKLNEIVVKAGGNNPHVKINVRDTVGKTDKDYITIAAQLNRNIKEIEECKEIVINLQEDEQANCNKFDDSCTLLEEMVISVMENREKSIIEEAEEVLQTALTIVPPKQFTDENLQEALEFIVDTFYESKEENFYTKNNKYKAINSVDKLMLFKEYVLYCIGTRYVKATGITKHVEYSFDNIDKTKGTQLIEAFVSLCGSEEDRARGLKLLTNIEILTVQEKLNYITNAF